MSKSPRIFYFILGIVLWLLAGPQLVSNALADSSIKFGFNPSNSEPLLFEFENHGSPIATGGLIYEVSVAIAEELGKDYSIVRVPRKRMAQDLEANKVDLICHNSMRWKHVFNKDGVQWSKPLYTYSNVLVGTKNVPFNSTEKVADVVLGTVGNYVYADLDTHFEEKKIQRSDGVSVAINLKKLFNHRVDYLIMSEVEFNFYKALYPELKRSSFSMDKTDIQCSLSKKSSLSLARLNAAITRLHRNHIINRIYERYLNPETSPKPFTYGLNSNDSPPFLFFEKSNSGEAVVTGGLFFDIGLEIGKRLQRPVNFVLLPRGRLSSRLAAGLIELVCYHTEAWAGGYADAYFWSVPISKQSNLIVSLKDEKGGGNVQTLDELKGKRIGTVLNFVYPSLTPYFKNGSIGREDAGSGAANIEKLSMRRVKFVVLNNLEYDYYKKKNVHLQRAPFVIDAIDVKCAVSKKSDLAIAKINEAIIKLQKTGQMRKILELRHDK